jgi:cholera toxin transcriptional activator
MRYLAGNIEREMAENPQGRLYRFGAFEADEKTGELRKQGRRLAVQGQPLQVLLMLLDRPGELITRTDIQQALWSDGTFVDFDHGLNTAINKIREALGDSAANPQFVETLAKRGYRFIAPVEVIGQEQGGPSGSAAAKPAFQIGRDAPASEASAPGFAQSLLTQPDETPAAPHTVVRGLLLLLQVMYLCFYVESLARLRSVEHVVSEAVAQYFWVVALVIVTAAVGIPIRLYLVSGATFRPPGLRKNFLKLFPAIFLLDMLWALAPFLLVGKIGFGLALASTAALLYSPFAQRSLILMATATAPRS